MKTRYFVNDSYKLDDNIVGRELYLKHGAYYFKDGIVSNCATFCGENEEYEIHIIKVEEMELSDFIADGRTKYELNGIRFVVDEVNNDGNDLYIDVTCDDECLIIELCGKSNHFKIGGDRLEKKWAIMSIHDHDSDSYHSHIEDVKLVTTCVQCGKDEVQDAGLCSDCTIKSDLVESVKNLTNLEFISLNHDDEIAYTSSQYVEAIDKEVPDAVNHPRHYTGAGIECIEAIKASMTPDALSGYLKGNVQKYLWRYEKKVNPVEDLKKARWYLDYLINELDKENV